jgi:hypothetical protein
MELTHVVLKLKVVIVNIEIINNENYHHNNLQSTTLSNILNTVNFNYNLYIWYA